MLKRNNMDIYEAPKSDLTQLEALKIKPIKAILIGLLISIVLTQIVSAIEVIIFGLQTNLDFSNEKEYQLLFVNNPLFLYIDLFLSAIVLFFSGVVVSKYTPTKEIKYISIVTILTFSFYLYSFYASNSFETYPLWFNVTALIVIPASILFGGITNITRR